MKRVLYALLATAIGDLLTTGIALNMGAVEANPIYGHLSAPLFVLFRLSYVGFCAIIVAIFNRYEAPKLLKRVLLVILWGSVVVHAAVCIWNGSVIASML